MNTCFLVFVINLTLLTFTVRTSVAAKADREAFQVSLQSPVYNGHFCSGAIIGTRHVVSAAHCFRSVNVSSIYVVAGTKYHNKGGQRRQVGKLRIHPKYTPDPDINDIAILTINPPFKFRKRKVQPVSIGEKEIGADIKAYSYGWNFMRANDKCEKGGSCDKLLEVEQSTVSNRQCDVYKGVRIHNTHLCVYSPKCKGFCLGDSGAPLVRETDKGAELIGIATQSFGPCVRFRPEIFTRMSVYSKFISHAIKKDTSKKRSRNLGGNIDKGKKKKRKCKKKSKKSNVPISAVNISTIKTQ